VGRATINAANKSTQIMSRFSPFDKCPRIMADASTRSAAEDEPSTLAVWSI